MICLLDFACCKFELSLVSDEYNGLSVLSWQYLRPRQLVLFYSVYFSWIWWTVCSCQGYITRHHLSHYNGSSWNA